jgi:hypothetical protein
MKWGEYTDGRYTNNTRGLQSIAVNQEMLPRLTLNNCNCRSPVIISSVEQGGIGHGPVREKPKQLGSENGFVNTCSFGLDVFEDVWDYSIKDFRVVRYYISGSLGRRVQFDTRRKDASPSMSIDVHHWRCRGDRTCVNCGDPHALDL